MAEPAHGIKELDPSFLYGNRIRAYLQALYVGLIGSSSNAQLLSMSQTGGIDRKSISGNRLVKSGLSYAISWLELAREFSISEEIFNSQFLQPAMLTAKFRTLAHSMLSLEGFVFSKSDDFFDRYFGGKTISLSVIVPVLQTVMSIRFRTEQSPGDVLGGVILRNVQPLPYVNRIHHYGVHIERTGVQPDLSSMHFLKTPAGDVNRFRSSMAFENFCEVYSTRFGRRYLGATAILTGRLVSVQLPTLVIQSLTGGETLSMLASDFMLSNSGMSVAQIESLRGHIVRVMAVIWYGRATKRGELQPEIFAVQPVDDENQAQMDDLIGYIRLRGVVPLVRLHEMFPNIDVSAEIPCVAVSGNQAIWQCGTADNVSVIEAFNETIRKIRMLRQQHLSGEGTLLAESNGVIDRVKLNREWKVHWLSSNRKLLETLLMLIKYRDDYGSLPGRMKDICRLVPSAEPESALHQILLLRGTGFLMKKKDRAIIRKQAVEIAHDAVRAELIQALESVFGRKHAVELNELEEITGYAPSIIIQALRELEKNGYVHPLHVGDRKCELVWIVKGSGDETEDYREEAMNALRNLENRVLLVLKGFPHPLHSSKILERLYAAGSPLSNYTLMMVLSELQEEGRLTGNEGMWSYPWEGRIMDLLSSRPQDLFSLHELMRDVSFPPMNAEDLRKILTVLEEKGLVWQPVKDFWCLNPRDDRERNLILQCILWHTCETFVIDEIKKHGGGVREDWLLHELRLFILKQRTELNISSDCQCPSPDEIIRNMLFQHALIRNNMMLVLNGDRSSDGWNCSERSGVNA